MKTNPLIVFAVRALFAVVLASLFGCATTPTQSSTTTFADPTASNVQLPRLIQIIRPEYPDEMRRAGITGEVVVECLVDAHGQVTETQVVSATRDFFIKPALAAVKKWSFTPGTRNGVPSTMRILIPVAFALDP